MKRTFKRYIFFVVTVIVLIIISLFNIEMGKKAINVTVFSLKTMILAIPPVFILLGLLDVWVSKEIMMKYMGEGSGIKGVLLAILIGSSASGPLYAAFPVAAVFMKKKVKFSNIVIFIGACSTTKIPMFLFEMASLGVRFAVTRLIVDMFGIIIIAYILTKFMKKSDIDKIYTEVEKF